MGKTLQYTNQKFPFGVVNKLFVDFIYYLTTIMENLHDTVAEQQKQLHINAIIDFVHSNPDQAGSIIADLRRDITHHVRYCVLQDFRSQLKANGYTGGGVKREDIPDEVMGILHCWCCDAPLRECLTLQEEGWTYTAHETDPFIFDYFKAAGMTRINENGSESIVTCGFSYS